MWINHARSRVALLISLLFAFGLAPLFPESDFTVGFTVGFLCGALCPFVEVVLGDQDAKTEGMVWFFIFSFFVGLSLLFTSYNVKGMLLLSYSAGAMASHLYLFLNAKRRDV